MAAKVRLREDRVSRFGDNSGLNRVNKRRGDWTARTRKRIREFTMHNPRSLYSNYREHRESATGCCSGWLQPLLYLAKGGLPLNSNVRAEGPPL